MKKSAEKRICVCCFWCYCHCYYCIIAVRSRRVRINFGLASGLMLAFTPDIIRFVMTNWFCCGIHLRRINLCYYDYCCCSCCSVLNMLTAQDSILYLCMYYAHSPTSSFSRFQLLLVASEIRDWKIIRICRINGSNSWQFRIHIIYERKSLLRASLKIQMDRSKWLSPVTVFNMMKQHTSIL